MSLKIYLFRMHANASYIILIRIRDIAACIGKPVIFYHHAFIFRLFIVEKSFSPLLLALQSIFRVIFLIFKLVCTIQRDLIYWVMIWKTYRLMAHPKR